MTTSSQLFERSLKVTPGGVHSPVRAFRSVGGTPVFFKSAQGPHLETVDGVKLIDFCMSFGPLILGHRDPEVSEAVEKMIRTAWSFGACEPYSLELAEWMTAEIPFLEKVRFVSSGTEAVMSALRVARAATQRQYILKFDGCYHGHVDQMLVKSGSGLAGLASQDSAGVSAQVASETIVAFLDDETGLQNIFSQFGGQIAAVIIEPIPANYGLLIQRKEFLNKVVDLARASGALLIFDEVISGFRVAGGGMAEILNVEPDLVTYGKVIGGGFPVGCYGGRRGLMDLVAPAGPVYQAGTLSANPVGMAAGLATLKKAKAGRVQKKLAETTEAWAEQLNSFFTDKGIPMEMSSFGSLFWIHEKTGSTIRNHKTIPSTHGPTFAKLFHECLKRGVYLAPSGYEVGFLSAAHTPDILQQAKEAIQGAALEVFKS